MIPSFQWCKRYIYIRPVNFNSYHAIIHGSVTISRFRYFQKDARNSSRSYFRSKLWKTVAYRPPGERFVEHYRVIGLQKILLKRHNEDKPFAKQFEHFWVQLFVDLLSHFISRFVFFTHIYYDWGWEFKCFITSYLILKMFRIDMDESVC